MLSFGERLHRPPVVIHDALHAPPVILVGAVAWELLCGALEEMLDTPLSLYRRSGVLSIRCTSDIGIRKKRRIRAMTNKIQGTRIQDNAFEFLRRGEKVPKAFLERRIAAVERQWTERASETEGINKKYATYWSQIQRATKAGKDPRDTLAIEGLLEIHKQLAKRKIAAPTPRIELGGIITARFGAVVTTPFDYAFKMFKTTVGSPAMSGSADRAAAQVGGSVVTDSAGRSAGYVYSEMGIYFRPKFGPAILRCSASPSCSYQWWTNSIQGSGVRSYGDGSFGIYDGTNPGSTVWQYTRFNTWFSDHADELHFDVAFDRIVPISFQTQLHVSPFSEYSVFVATENSAFDQHGWPGSLAGSELSVMVPSITLELNPQVLEP
jgi:hypothetical protein